MTFFFRFKARRAAGSEHKTQCFTFKLCWGSALNRSLSLGSRLCRGSARDQSQLLEPSGYGSRAPTGAGGQSLRLVPMPMARLLGAGLRLSSGASSPARGAETLCQTAKKEGTKQKQPDPSHVGTTCRRGTRVAETDLSHPSCNQLLDLLRRPNCSPATYKIKKKKNQLSIICFKTEIPFVGY